MTDDEPPPTDVGDTGPGAGGSITATLDALARDVLGAGALAGLRALGRLVAVADRVARATDRFSLLDRERELARREERRRLARDLHDSVVQQVLAISMQARSMDVLARHGDAVDSGVVRRHAEEVGDLASTALAELRATVSGLAPTTAAPVGLGEAVGTLVESAAERSGARFSLSVGPTVDDLGPGRAEDLRRIVAEAIRNVEKHAEAGRVTLRLSVRGSAVVATVSDDGKGFAAGGDGACPGTFGLTSMRERAERWGGTLEVRARPRGGTSVRAVLPLPRARTPVMTRGGTPSGPAG